MTLRDLSRMAEIEGKGRGLVAQHDRRSLLGEVFDALLRNPVMTARGLARSLQVSNQSATSALRALLAAGLVKEATGRESFSSIALKP